MTGTKLAVHGMFEHMDFEGIRAWQPKSIKIINPDIERCRRAYEAYPAALFVLRDHPLSEQHDDLLRDPASTGRRHAEEYAQHVPLWAPMIPRGQVLVMGINEPHVWEAGVEAALDIYTEAFLNRCAEFDLGAGACNFGVGWPTNRGTDMPVDWMPYARTLASLRRYNRHKLIVHEYCNADGPMYMWRWWMGRWQQCPWDVPILIGECGMDCYTSDPGASEASRGWQAHVSAETYLDYLAWYDTQLRLDSRVHSAQIFTFDYAHPWASFDVRPMRQKLITYAQSIAFDSDPVLEPSDLAAVLRSAAEGNDVLRVNPDAALCKAGAARGLWPTSNEFELDCGGVYVAQRFRDPQSNVISVLYCRKGEWSNVAALEY